MRTIQASVLVLWMTLCCPPLFAQEETPTQLNNQFDATSYYADQERAAWANNAARMTELNSAFGAAISDLSKENSRRLQEILAANSQAHEAVSQQDLSSADRAAESQRIQAETARERAELSSWYQQSRETINAEHVAQRAAQLAATRALVERIGQERIATLQRLINGPVPLASLPPLTFPDETGGGATDDRSTGSTAGASGVDLAGSVPLDNPGDELVANENTERYALHERLFNEEKERRRRAEEEVANQVMWVESRVAEANTRASARPQPPVEDCELQGDMDGDGAISIYCGGDDCDDTDARRYPGNTEVGDGDGFDEDCDPTTFGNVDNDGDGFYSARNCNYSGGRAYCGNDCDDSKASVNPVASEVCNYVDDNCDSRVDENVLAQKFLDRDGDTHGDPAASIYVCAQTYQSPYGGDWLSAIGNDCDDTDPNIWNGCAQQ